MNVLLAGVVAVVNNILTIYLIVLFAAAVLRWVRADESSGIVRTLYVITDPPARWLARKFPKLVVRSGMSVIDLSPAILMVGIGCIKILLDHLYTYLRMGA